MYSLGLGATGLLLGDFCHSRCSDFPKDKADICIREKFSLRPAELSSTLSQKGTQR